MSSVSRSRSDIIGLIASLVVMHGCFIYFGLLFRLWSASFIPHMSYLGLFLIAFAIVVRRPFLEPFRASHLLKGFLCAIALYGIFYAGNFVSSYLIPTAGRDVLRIYDLGENLSRPFLALLLAFPIAFGEEIFWRGCLQKFISERWSPKLGFFLTMLAYTLAHVASKNIMLIGAAAVCGIFWGYLYYRTNSILICIISHMIWDPLIFVLLPVG